jgi:hypothetical protein
MKKSVSLPDPFMREIDSVAKSVPPEIKAEQEDASEASEPERPLVHCLVCKIVGGWELMRASYTKHCPYRHPAKEYEDNTREDLLQQIASEFHENPVARFEFHLHKVCPRLISRPRVHSSLGVIIPPRAKRHRWVCILRLMGKAFNRAFGPPKADVGAGGDLPSRLGTADRHPESRVRVRVRV